MYMHIHTCSPVGGKFCRVQLQHVGDGPSAVVGDLLLPGQLSGFPAVGEEGRGGVGRAWEPRGRSTGTHKL